MDLQTVFDTVRVHFPALVAKAKALRAGEI